MKLSVKTAIIVHATWNAFGRTGANGVIALQSVAMDIVLGTDVFWIDFLIRETWTKMKFHPKPMIFINWFNFHHMKRRRTSNEDQGAYCPEPGTNTETCMQGLIQNKTSILTFIFKIDLSWPFFFSGHFESFEVPEISDIACPSCMNLYENCTLIDKQFCTDLRYSRQLQNLCNKHCGHCDDRNWL